VNDVPLDDFRLEPAERSRADAATAPMQSSFAGDLRASDNGRARLEEAERARWHKPPSASNLFVLLES
jgi:hypothetical protein